MRGEENAPATTGGRARWRSVSLADAREHPAYGIGGWVAAIIIIAGFKTLGSILYLITPDAIRPGYRPLGDWPLGMQLAFVGNLAANGALLVTALVRSRFFVVAAFAHLAIIVTLLLTNLAGLVDPLGLYDFEALPPEDAERIRAAQAAWRVALDAATTLSLACAIAAYAALGARPNITFRHRVRVEPPQNAA